MCVCDVCIGTSGMYNRREEVCLVVMAPSPASVGSLYLSCWDPDALMLNSC